MFIIPDLPEGLFKRTYRPLPPNTFSTTSLVRWMDFVHKAKVPAVEATTVGVLNIEHLLSFDEIANADAMHVAEQLEAINKARKPGHMLRWDACAGLSLKEKMAYGKEVEACDFDLNPGEPRTFDILYEIPAEEVAVLERPWVNAKMMDNFPVEFRVFVNEGVVKAIANYYLQRPLEDMPQMRDWMKRSIDLTNQIIAVVKEEGLCPAFSRQSNPGQDFSATLDFMVNETGEVLFLEAGPGFGFGAHPCSFLHTDGINYDPVVGAKMGSEKPSIPLDEL